MSGAYMRFLRTIATAEIKAIMTALVTTMYNAMFVPPFESSEPNGEAENAGVVAWVWLGCVVVNELGDSVIIGGSTSKNTV